MELPSVPTIEAQTASSVYEVNLTYLSKLAGLSEEEFLTKIQTDAIPMHGVMSNPGQEVAFKMNNETFSNKDVHLDKDSEVAKCAVITSVSKLVKVDSAEMVFLCMLQFGEFTLLEHIIAQLYSAGFELIFLLLTADTNGTRKNEEIVNHMKKSVLSSKIAIEFVTSTYTNDSPRSIFTIRDRVTGPFIIHPIDAIFEKHILEKLAGATNYNHLITAFVNSLHKIKSSGDFIASADRQKESVPFYSEGNLSKVGQTICSGLMLTNDKFFSVFDQLFPGNCNPDWEQMLQVLYAAKMLRYTEDHKAKWLSIANFPAYSAAVKDNQISTLPPWPIFIVKDPSDSFSEQNNQDITRSPRRSSILLAVSSGESGSNMRSTSLQSNFDYSEGFIVGVNRLHHTGDTLPPTRGKANSVDEYTPLFRKQQSYGSAAVQPHNKMFKRQNSMLTEKSKNPFVVSIPCGAVEEGPEVVICNDDIAHCNYSSNRGKIYPIRSDRKALLIEVPEAATKECQNQMMLAVPSISPIKIRSRINTLSRLPSDVKNLSVETVEHAWGNVELQLIVDRKVPYIGYLLLISSLITLSSLGPALDTQHGVHPFMKLFWRSTASLIFLYPLSCFFLYVDGMPKITRPLFQDMVACGVTYAIFIMTFLWSLDYTTINHAYLFSNSHSLLLILGRVAMGIRVSGSEGIGAGMGVFGGIVICMDSSRSKAAERAGTIHPSLVGDLVALLGAVGGVYYLILAKRLRNEINVCLQLAITLTMGAAIVLLVFYVIDTPFEVSIDRNIGLFGWVDNSRILSETYIVLVCTMIGTLGWVGVMKYFDPIVTSVVTLLEPILACVMGLVIGVEQVPGWVSVIGSLLIVFGTYLVVVSNNSTSEAINATTALSPRFKGTSQLSTMTGSAFFYSSMSGKVSH